MSSKSALSQKAKLDELIAKAPKELEPTRDLWPGIEFALDNSKQASQQFSKQHVVWGIAASILLVGFIALLSFESGKQVSGNNLVQQLSEQHVKQKDALLVSLKDQVAVTQNWQQQLQELDEAAIAIKKALANEPNNVALLKMLKQVHQQQIALIERVHTPAWQKT